MAAVQRGELRSLGLTFQGRLDDADPVGAEVAELSSRVGHVGVQRNNLQCRGLHALMKSGDLDHFEELWQQQTRLTVADSKTASTCLQEGMLSSLRGDWQRPAHTLEGRSAIAAPTSRQRAGDTSSWPSPTAETDQRCRSWSRSEACCRHPVSLRRWAAGRCSAARSKAWLCSASPKRPASSIRC